MLRQLRMIWLVGLSIAVAAPAANAYRMSFVNTAKPGASNTTVQLNDGTVLSLRHDSAVADALKTLLRTRK